MDEPTYSLDELVAIAETVEHFADNFAEIATTLLSVYDCALTCNEAEALAELFRVAGNSEAADIIIADHASTDDEPGDLHYQGEGV
jgi:hypothetical protein